MSKQWTAVDIPDLTGKVALVTGANSGIGLETTRELARRGARVVMACRDGQRAVAAQAAMQQEIPQARLEILPLNLANLASVRAAAEQFLAQEMRLDLLINNAGIMVNRYAVTDDGFESQMGVNHLGHFALTGLLLPLLLQTPGSRVVTVSSQAHQMGKMDFTNLMFAGGQGFVGIRAYGRSKLANLLFTYELQRRLAQRAAPVIAVAAHPGAARTNIGRDPQQAFFSKLFMAVFVRLTQPAAIGALPILRAATDPTVQGGAYYGPGGMFGQRGSPIKARASAASRAHTDAVRLWELSAELTGVAYEALA